MTLKFLIIALMASFLIVIIYFYIRDVPSENKRQEDILPISGKDFFIDQNGKRLNEPAVLHNNEEISPDEDLPKNDRRVVKDEVFVATQQVVTKKNLKEMTEIELVAELDMQQDAAYLIEIVNQIGAYKVVSDQCIENLLNCIGKKNADVDAYVIKLFALKATTNEKVMNEIISIIKTNRNAVVRRCAADAIGEFQSAFHKLDDLKQYKENEFDVRVKLKLEKSIQRLELLQK